MLLRCFAQHARSTAPPAMHSIQANMCTPNCGMKVITHTHTYTHTHAPAEADSASSCCMSASVPSMAPPAPCPPPMPTDPAAGLTRGREGGAAASAPALSRVCRDCACMHIEAKQSGSCRLAAQDSRVTARERRSWLRSHMLAATCRHVPVLTHLSSSFFQVTSDSLLPSMAIMLGVVDTSKANEALSFTSSSALCCSRSHHSLKCSAAPS
eukprot:1156319-Pelagomonas_calceolata.AAC.14